MFWGWGLVWWFLVLFVIREEIRYLVKWSEVKLQLLVKIVCAYEYRTGHMNMKARSRGPRRRKDIQLIRKSDPEHDSVSYYPLLSFISSLLWSSRNTHKEVVLCALLVRWRSCLYVQACRFSLSKPTIVKDMLNRSNHSTSMPMQDFLAEEYGSTVCKILSDQKHLAHNTQQMISLRVAMLGFDGSVTLSIWKPRNCGERSPPLGLK